MPPGCFAARGLSPPTRSARNSAGAGRAERISRRKRAEFSPTTDHHTTAPSSHARASTGMAFLRAISHMAGRPGTSGRDSSEVPVIAR